MPWVLAPLLVVLLPLSLSPFCWTFLLLMLQLLFFFFFLSGSRPRKGGHRCGKGWYNPSEPSATTERPSCPHLLTWSYFDVGQVGEDPTLLSPFYRRRREGLESISASRGAIQLGVDRTGFEPRGSPMPKASFSPHCPPFPPRSQSGWLCILYCVTLKQNHRSRALIRPFLHSLEHTATPASNLS